jgi:hypothetical protein
LQIGSLVTGQTSKGTFLAQQLQNPCFMAFPFSTVNDSSKLDSCPSELPQSPAKRYPIGIEHADASQTLFYELAAIRMAL